MPLLRISFILLFALSYCLESAEKLLEWEQPQHYDVSFLATPSMQEWVNHPSIKNKRTQLGKANAIISLLFGKDGSGFSYHPQITLSPDEAFKQRKGNCITFAMLFVTLSRSIGVNSIFNEVKGPPGWNHTGDIVIETGHINVVVRDLNQNLVIEWLDSFRDLSNRYINLVSDDTIRSDFFNNIAVQAMGSNRLDVAEVYIKHAMTIAPQNSRVWQNQGVLQVQIKDFDAAEQSFLQAIQLEKHDSSLYMMLSKLYEQTHQKDLAKRYAKKGNSYAPKSPFYHYKQALNYLDGENPNAAIKHLKKALKKLPDYHLFHYTLAKCYEQLGDTENHRTELATAIALTETPVIQERYMERLNELNRLTQKNYLSNQ